MKNIIFRIKNFLIENQIFSFTKSHKTFIFMLICLIFGMILGSIASGCVSFELMEKVNNIFISDFKERISKSSLDIFMSSLLLYSTFFIMFELSALSIWGILAIPIMIIFKGIGIGMCGGYLYLIYSLKGIAFYILMLMPGIFISSLTMVLFATEMFKFSLGISKRLLNPNINKPFNNRFLLKNHLKKLSYCLMMLCLSSVVDLCFAKMFSSFFSF